MQITNTVGTTMLDALLWSITDYDCVRLTKVEYKKAIERVLDLDDYENVEKEINIFLKEVGYTYNSNESLWERESDAPFLEIDERVIEKECNTVVKLWTGKYDYYLFQTDATNEESRQLLEEMQGIIQDYSDADIIPYFTSKGFEAIEIPIPRETVELSW